MKITWKKGITILFLLIVVLTIIFREALSYGFQQARGQFEVIWEAQPVEKYLDSPEFPDSLKSKIKLVQEVRRFAIDSLGLNDSENYTTLYDQKGKDILWNLSAVKEYEMQAKEWQFPFLGSFSYKGFFEQEKALQEKTILDQEGYDTRIRPVGGWSTLGWFKDPILSNMLYRKEGQLAELIIHELTHATLYIKDSVEFNENLATFIGKKGALQFLTSRFGSQSREISEYQQSFIDSQNFANHMLRGYKSLDSLYNIPDFSDQEDSIRKRRKENLIAQIVNDLDTLTYSNKTLLKGAFSKNLPNNAYFMAFKRYRSKQGIFDQEYQENYESDIKQLIQYYASKYPSL